MPSTTPLRSPTFIRPSHRLITPVRPRAISKPVLAESNSAATTSRSASGCPSANALNPATANAMTKNASQIQLSMRAGRVRGTAADGKRRRTGAADRLTTAPRLRFQGPSGAPARANGAGGRRPRSASGRLALAHHHAVVHVGVDVPRPVLGEAVDAPALEPRRPDE